MPRSFLDRKSTRLNSSHLGISYAVFCLKKNIGDALPPGALTDAQVVHDADPAHVGRRPAPVDGGKPGRRPVGVFFNDTATTEIYTLSLHDALPISTHSSAGRATAHLWPLPGRWAVRP